jgi:hypothetical protein
LNLTPLYNIGHTPYFYIIEEKIKEINTKTRKLLGSEKITQKLEKKLGIKITIEKSVRKRK